MPVPSGQYSKPDLKRANLGLRSGYWEGTMKKLTGSIRAFPPEVAVLMPGHFL